MSKRYSTIIADPPWKYGPWRMPSNKIFKRYTEQFFLPYKHMEVTDICNLPVPSITADDCQLFLWATNRYLPEAFKVLEAWGFKYAQTLTWCKTPRGTGQGGLFTPTTEFILVGRRGKMPNVTRIDSTWFNWKRTNIHSQKPSEANQLIEKVSNPPYLELFARSKFKDWDVWGNEIEGINLTSTKGASE